MENYEDFRRLFRESVGTELLQDVSLRDLSSFKIGGRADLFFQARKTDDLLGAVSLAVRKSVPFYVIGGGFNILFDDAGYRGLLIKNGIEGMTPLDEEGKLEVSSGTTLTAVLQTSLERGYAGLAFLAGIPGTFGGAVYGNAGAFGRSIADVLESAVLLHPREGKTSVLRKDDLDFGYRRSLLQETRDIVIRADLKAFPENPGEVLKTVRDIMGQRKIKHPPPGTACAGSFFKNPCSPDGERSSAGFLLEKAGARGLSVGDAAVFEGHCNFLVNRGQAKSGDVLRLAAELKERVYQKFGVRLEEEVIYLSAAASMI